MLRRLDLRAKGNRSRMNGYFIVYMIRWNGLKIAPDTSQVLREVDPKVFVGPK
jgi:hypothetical protein